MTSPRHISYTPQRLMTAIVTGKLRARDDAATYITPEIPATPRALETTIRSLHASPPSLFPPSQV
jgi:hypothetical protein